MNRFQIIQPSVLLAPYVKQYWFLTMDRAGQISQRLFPVGCAGLSLFREQQVYSSSENCFLPGFHVSGQYTAYTDMSIPGNSSSIAIIFQPAGIRAFFTVPASEFENRKVSVAALSDPQLLELGNRLTDTTRCGMCVELIEKFLLKRICRIGGDHRERMESVVRSIDNGQCDISALAQTACLSYKQFKRIFTESVGSNPKDYLRITRFRKAIRIMQICPQVTLSELAESCGYFDKSHLIKEMKEFSGYTPGEYLSVQRMELDRQNYKPYDPNSDQFSLFRSAFSDR
ncbi:MAG: helix-turn-helix domain-containing protein [Bacteroidales bacterium]|jgi:AraC-like DNA-binding protein|nr:helix-turn-helix domain-containing protein [Bacteroidales bacterium]